MSTLVAPHRSDTGHSRPTPGGALRPRPVDRRERTLDDVITGAWECLADQEPVRCPACGGEMVRGRTAGALEGACRDCAARLS